MRATLSVNLSPYVLYMYSARPWQSQRTALALQNAWTQSQSQVLTRNISLQPDLQERILALRHTHLDIRHGSSKMTAEIQPPDTQSSERSGISGL